MSWQAAAFGLLGLALVAGFAWYERARPDARVVALVATLAALAALGRIAFAAVPNVKPTTDIVLIAGYCLGAGPGFAVGALAGLTSNFFFGQGPWTPWQMAAWGATGMLGAGLAWGAGRLARRGLREVGVERAVAPAVQPPVPHRVVLALVCLPVGFAFTALQDVGDWVTYSDHSSAQLAAYVGQGLGFDGVHGAGCLLFALAFGPALIRSIQRFTRRLEVNWIAPGGAFPLAVLVIAVLGGLAVAGGPASGSASAATGGESGEAVSYLVSAQNADGGLGAAPGQPSSSLYAGWGALGLAAAGRNPAQVAKDGHTLIGYLERSVGSRMDTGSLERTILAAAAAGSDLHGFGGQDLVALLDGRRRGDGSFGGQVNLTAFAILAERAAGEAPSARTVGWLMRQQNRDEGFGFGVRGTTSDVDDTGAVLEALGGRAGAGRLRAGAVRYLRGRQNRDGGFPQQPGESSNAQSTAWAVQGLDAAGVDSGSLHLHGAPSPLGYLDSLISSGGSIRYARGQEQTPVWVTGEALMALEGKPLPLARVPRHADRPSRSVNPGVTASRTRRTHLHRRSRGPARRRSAGSGAGPATVPMSRLASGVGWATAVLLAPMGLG
jgi:energy-coupling factor transport system substrate-specific component